MCEERLDESLRIIAVKDNHWGEVSTKQVIVMNPNMMGGPGAGGHGYDSGMGPPGMGPPGMDMGMGMGGMGMERMFPAIKLRGLPFDVSEDDIRMFIVRTGRSDFTLSINHDLTFLPCISSRAVIQWTF